MIGSGPFSVIEHNANRLKLKAFDAYYACRVLTDIVTIWIVNDEKMENPSLTGSVPINVSETLCGHYVSTQDDKAPHDGQHTRTEDGCLFALFNHHAKQPLSRAQRRYIAELIQPERLAEAMRKENTVFRSVPASNLLPSWKPVYVLLGQNQVTEDHHYRGLQLHCASSLRSCYLFSAGIGRL